VKGFIEVTASDSNRPTLLAINQIARVTAAETFDGTYISLAGGGCVMTNEGYKVIVTRIELAGSE
jgi:hypothetical protein